MELRRKRFLKIWAKHFAIAVGIALGSIIGLVTFIAGMLYLVHSYGPGIALAIVAVMLLLIGLGGMTHSLTTAKLKQIEAEEERTMAALRKETPHPDPDMDRFNQYLNDRIKQMRNQKTLFKPKTSI